MISMPSTFVNEDIAVDGKDVRIMMTKNNKDKEREKDSVDINEVFDDILFCEELAEQSGFEEGLTAGKSHSIKGYHLGYHRGSELSAKLGFYSILVQHCLEKNTSPSSKIHQQAIKLRDQISCFPRHNDELTDILQLSEDIKFKLIRLCSLAKIDSSYPESDKLNF